MNHNSFGFHSAQTLSDGLEKLAEIHPDIILLDLSLPDSQGFETFDRTIAAAPKIPIVMLTGLADDDLAIRAVQAGAQDYLVKGQVDGNLLARTIRYAIERKQSESCYLKRNSLPRTL